jgi:hypothetical protein
MRLVLILALASLASLIAWNRRSETPDGEMRVTKTELVAEHDPQFDPQVCRITATGREGSSRVEYNAVKRDGDCPAIETILVHHDGMLTRKNDSSLLSGDSSFWSAVVQSRKVIQ